MAVELAHLVLVGHRDQPDPRGTQVLLALPDLRVMLANVDQKDPVVFRVPLDQLVVELEEPQFPVPLALPVLRAIMVFLVLLDPLVPPEQMDNPDPRAMSVLLALLGPRVLPDLLENAVLPVRMRLPRSSTSISPRMRRLRPTERRRMSKMHSDRLTHSRTVLGTTLR